MQGPSIALGEPLLREVAPGSAYYVGKARSGKCCIASFLVTSGLTLAVIQNVSPGDTLDGAESRRSAVTLALTQASGAAWRQPASNALQPGRLPMAPLNGLLRDSPRGDAWTSRSTAHGTGAAWPPLYADHVSRSSTRCAARISRKEQRLQQELDNSTRKWVDFQAGKHDDVQAPLTSYLMKGDPAKQYDIAVVGTGPAGIAISAELAKQGFGVVLIGPESCFVNNYGIFADELQEMGMDYMDTIVQRYDKMKVLLSDSEQFDLDRPYARVGRRELRHKLLTTAKEHGVEYLEAMVDAVNHEKQTSTLRLSGLSGIDKSVTLRCRIPVLALGHNRELLEYDDSGPRPTMQTAYGMEVKWKDHPWPTDALTFMDFRFQEKEFEEAKAGKYGEEAKHSARFPSILYAFAIDKDTVFLQETCLVAPTGSAVPFDELKARIFRRLERMGLVDKGLEWPPLEEEASWIPLGGTLPTTPQRAVAFGAAAGLVHPVSGYQIANMLTRAPHVARAIAQGLRDPDAEVPAEEGARLAYEELWGDDRRRQQGFYEFGMRMMLTFEQPVLRDFFRMFFKLPKETWQGFLSHRLTGLDLLLFALKCFVVSPNEIRWRLVGHVFHEGAGVRLAEQYMWPVLKSAGLTSSFDRRSEPPA